MILDICNNCLLRKLGKHTTKSILSFPHTAEKCIWFPKGDQHEVPVLVKFI